MAFFFGSGLNELIAPGFLSGSVIPSPSGATPSAADDVLYGGGGDDIINGGGGSDQAFGGTGNDHIFAVIGIDTADGGGDNDTLDTTLWALNYTINLATGLTNFAGESFVNFENLIAGAGNDWLVGTSDANAIWGGDGNDIIDGGLGGRDSLYGQAGDDTIIASTTSAITLDGGTGIDRLDVSLFAFDYALDLATGWTNFFGEFHYNFEDVSSGSGNDTLTGTSGSNTIYGGFGDDVIVSGGGLDSLMGGFGDDTIVVGLAAAGTKVYGDDGNDTLSTTDYSGKVNLNLYTGVMKLGSAVTYAFRCENIMSGNGNDVLTGDLDNNRIDGNSGNDSIKGNDGNDRLGGQFGNDTLLGGAGSDSLYGDEGSDRLTGGAGVDQLFGGIGADRFIFTKASDSGPVASDTIRDSGEGGFEGAGAAAGDLIDLSKIDADTTLAGNQTFAFGGSSRGQVLVVDGGSGNSIVFANTDNDVDFEFRLLIEDGGVLASAYTAADFLL